MLFPFLKGFGTSAGLIIAIGAQNAFVLSQGVRRNHHLVIPLICSFFDALLITVGILGVGTAVASHPLLTRIAAWGGAAFLFWYGACAFRSALRGGNLETEDAGRTPLKTAILATLAVTLLNPHVYLDTLVLMGGISGQYPLEQRPWFGLGAATASFAWFFLLSLGGNLLAPFFKKQAAWRILDSLVGLIMWGIAFSLLINMA
ncbi:LysE/ArgO family amino acid transporter [Desulfoluna spongiiphila]|uniref:L-lysine exporter family protein LysE/ArgO n=1 Tax=Desulfoluna spongiiphila TaxID=419481 RepID=A0A1G5AVG8_9BACT|nr:LysE/ArgO family amino acid transporter [Desulfoluna spongiiphila]SCX81834.1 L-lysine exporter family protein LysE/ArgO [Desulfoluna spongiiphila]VVS92032.1 amino acid exporter protein leue-type [Desulfoluna spongiiphila]